MSGVRFSALCRLVSLTFDVSRFESRLAHDVLLSKSHRRDYSTRNARGLLERDFHRAATTRYSTDATSRLHARTNISSGRVSRRFGLAANGTSLEIKKPAVRQAEEVRVGRSIALLVTSAAIRGWNFSKEVRPSGTAVHRTVGKLLTSGFHSSAWQASCKRGSDDENITRDPCECIKRPKDVCEESSHEKDVCASRDPCEEKVICTEGTRHEKASFSEDSCTEACRPTVCKIPRLVCPPPSLSQLYPMPDEKTVKIWRSLVLFLVMPIVLVSAFVLISRSRKAKKQPRPPFLDVPYLHRRTKAFPWGDGHHSLFHNPRTNGIPPHGYEVEDPYAEKSEK